MRDMVQSVSKKSIMKAGVKQVQAGEKQKKMKESTLDNKKIKLFSKFFESQNNCKKVALIASKLMTWKPEHVQKLLCRAPSSALERPTRAPSGRPSRRMARSLGSAAAEL
eukprot:m51a1_g11454 hypothetical protein (110) ;mRNA; r:10-6356